MNEVKSNNVYTKIPELISWICQQRLQNSNKTYQKIWEFVQTDPFGKLFFSRIFEAEHRDKDLKTQMGSYGVKGIRDRLTSHYLFYLTEGSWAKAPDLSYTLEVQQFEERFSEFSNEWDSRVFMLGCYLRMKDLQLSKLEEPDEYEINISLDLDEVLTHGKAKIEKLDWLIITLKSLLKFTTKEKIITWLNSESENFYDIVNTLEVSEQKTFLNDLLLYGNAIGDQEFFVFNKV